MSGSVVARVAAALLFAIALPLHALELRVLSAGAVEPGMRPALAAFERDSGHAVRLTFAAAPALRGALREDPDVIMIGEMRDLETISLAITASETG